ncbi:unnamed protein product [Diplocarpon coronariae]|uniref:MT-A70-domain-containing protein n=1 Tax=Diplocarpon coronariae TaxID=2795749 RepID=A0A218Z656_9HELO|nr:hypothetical protein B2J93_7210 [Marssonina coronariae]
MASEDCYGPCILYTNKDNTVILIDIPRSIELAQGRPLMRRKLISCKPPILPLPSLEPKSAKARAQLLPHTCTLRDLVLRKILELALDQVKEGHTGEWCGKRLYYHSTPTRKRKRESSEDSPVISGHAPDYWAGDSTLEDRSSTSSAGSVNALPEPPWDNITAVHINRDVMEQCVRLTHGATRETVVPSFYLPPKAAFILGDVMKTIDSFKQKAPKFDLVVMDPPWPNRSAERKGDYRTCYDAADIRGILCSLPLADHLTGDGIVAVWITNKEHFRDMLLDPSEGLFDKWGVTLAEEWVWLKTTTSGEPVYPLKSSWRKPYEILLVGRRGYPTGKVMRRVIIGVPDLHSRKPNGKVLFEMMMKNRVDKKVVKDKYEALEIFARNLTAGWWSWGMEPLKFQSISVWPDYSQS